MATGIGHTLMGIRTEDSINPVIKEEEVYTPLRMVKNIKVIIKEISNMD